MGKGTSLGMVTGIENTLIQLRKKIEEENEQKYERGVKDGFKQGYDDCKYNSELIDELKQDEYNKGYLNGRNSMAQENDALVKQGIEKGIELGWECARKIFGYALEDREEMFNTDSYSAILQYFTGDQAIKIVSEHKDEIKVGDEVRIIDSPVLMIVTAVGDIRIEGINQFGMAENYMKDEVEKTGKVYPNIDVTLRSLRGERL